MIQKFKGKDGQHYFRVKAANGRTLATSEGYKTVRKRDKGILSLIDNIPAWNMARYYNMPSRQHINRIPCLK